MFPRWGNSLGICVSQVGEHISLGICVSLFGEHLSLGICVFLVGEHISLGVCVSQVGEHLSLGVCDSQVGEHIIYKVLSLYYLRLLPLLAAVFILEFLCKSLLFSLRVYVCIHAREN